MDEIELTMSNDNIRAKANVSGDEVGGEEGSAPPSKKREHGMMASESEDLELNAAETTVQGQMKINPGFTIEQAKAAAKKGKASLTYISLYGITFFWKSS